MGGADIDDFVLMKKVRIKIPKLKRNKSTLYRNKKTFQAGGAN